MKQALVFASLPIVATAVTLDATCSQFAPVVDTTYTVGAGSSGELHAVDAGSFSTLTIKSFTNTTSNAAITGGYIAHLHATACSVKDGSGHYLYDTTVPAPAVEANEVWYPLNVVNGVSKASTARPFSLRIPEAQSVVVHDTVAKGRTKLFCCDLKWTGTTAACGAFALTSNAAKVDAALDATVTVSNEVPVVYGSVSIPSSSLGAGPQPVHLHDRSCADNKAGGHFMYNKTIPAPAVESNEVWFKLVTDATGKGTGAANSQGVFTIASESEAKSIVIHEGNNAAAVKPKALCCDLTWNNNDGTTEAPATTGAPKDTNGASSLTVSVALALLSFVAALTL